MILHNCTVLTMDPRMPTASALPIAGGRIIGGVDSREDAIASHAHERIDLDGAWVVPGFVDAHVHFAGWAQMTERLDLRGCATVAELAAALDSEVGDAPVHGSGWDEISVLGTKGLSEDAARQLEQAARGRPMVLGARDGHSLIVNEPALERAGLDAGTLAAEGPLERSGGVLLLREGAAWSLRNAFDTDPPSVATMARAVRTALSRGVTAVHDMDGAAALANWRALEAERGMQLRVWQHLHRDELAAARTLRVGTGFGSDFLRIAGLKVFADGTLSSGTAWCHGQEQHALIPASELYELAREATAAGLPLVVHAIGDGAAKAAAQAIVESGHAAAPQLGAARPRIEHAQLVDDETLGLCVEHGIVISIQPSHLAGDAPAAETAWASQVGQAYRWADMESADAHIVLGSDAPVEDLHPTATLAAAIARRPAPWEHARLSGEAALAATTTAAHDAVGAGTELGRLSKGYRADLVVLADDPRTTPDVEVIATMVDGRFVFGRSRLSQA